MKNNYILSILLLGLSFLANAQPGTLYNGFSTNGYDLPDVSAGNRFSEATSKILLQADGKKLIVFDINYFNVMVARYNVDGTLDASYGQGGFSQTAGDIGFFGFSAALQADGKVVVVGSAEGAIPSDYVIVRYNITGQLDNTFGINGRVFYDFGFDDDAKRVLVQPDGKILVGGMTTVRVNNNDYVSMLRLNANGTLDPSFGFGGRRVNITFEGARFEDMKLFADGKIAVLCTPPGGFDVLLAKFNSDGSPDITFSTDGYIEQDYGYINAGVSALAIQADGKWVVGGYAYNSINSDFLISRFTADGAFDPSFHGDGKQVTHIGGGEFVEDLAIQTDGKVVVGGNMSNVTGGYFAMARYTTSGELDGGYGIQGTWISSFAGYDNGAFIRSILIQPDGRIIAAGNASKKTNFYVTDIAVATYTNNGQPDVSQVLAGQFVSYYQDNGSTIFWKTAVQPDGKIVMAGEIWNGIDYDFLVARYNVDGTPDNGFGTNGFQKTDFGGNAVLASSDDYARAILLQTDGKILVAGTFYSANESLFAIARYNTNGTLDDSFDADGKATVDVTGIFDEADALAIQADGKILIGGNSLDNLTDFNYALVRLASNGTPDASFGTAGIVISDWGYSDHIFGLAIQADGKILAAGSTSLPSTFGGFDFNVARYNTNGTLDAGFGVNGRQTTDFFNSFDFANSVFIQPGGKIIVGGSIINTDNNSYDYGLARYNADGSKDLSFGNNGKAITDFGANDYMHSTTMEADGKFIAAGYSAEQSSTNDPARSRDIALAKYNINGTLNGCFADRGKAITDLGGLELIFGAAVSADKLYIVGYQYQYNSFLAMEKNVGLVAAYNLTGGIVSLSCPPGGLIEADAETGQCYATITTDLADPLLCPDNSPGNINYTISLNNVEVETGNGTVKGKQFPVGTSTVTYTVTGNTALTCSFMIKVYDKQVPTITCPASQILNVGAQSGCSASLPNYASLSQASDNCTSQASLQFIQIPLPGTLVSGFGTIQVSLTAKDASGNLSVPCTFTVSKEDLTGPDIISCAPDITVNVTPGTCGATVSQFGLPTATENCGGMIVFNIPATGVYPAGTTNINRTATDARGNTSTCIQTITVIDNEFPVISNESVSQVILSPANHTMRTVNVPYTATDNCGVTTTLLVTSNEPINGTGDGDTDPDYIVMDNHTVQLRAERSANGNGRIYTITIRAVDTYGNVTTKTLEVRVPHDIKSPRSGQPFVINSTVNFSGEFWDKLSNRHTAKWMLDGSAVSNGIVIEPTANQNGKVNGSYKFTSAGVYKLQMNITDQAGVTSYSNTNGDLDAIVVIYDPNGSYAFGGGWYPSAAGALRNNLAATGKASYGFAVNYTNAARPKGETQFEFKIGTFEFNALNFDYLAVSGARGQFRGTGKIIGGQSGVGFIMTVIDGAIDGSNIDKIRLKIYNRNTGQVYYDNQNGASDAENPTTAVGINSSIFIQGTQPNNFVTKTASEKSKDKILAVSKLELVAFPNPSNKDFTIMVKTNDTKEQIQMTITDGQGRILETKNNLQAGNIIKVGETYRAGVYIIKIVQGKHHEEMKLVKL